MKNEAGVLKALADNNRLLIVEMLSCGEMCACDIIKGLKLTQPTISHHMKILINAGLVISEKRGKWIFYSLELEKFYGITDFLSNLIEDKDGCVCNTVEKCSC